MLPLEDEYAIRSGVVALRAPSWVVSAHKLVGVVGGDIAQHEIVIFDFTEATSLDDGAAMPVAQLIGVAHRSRTEVIVMGLKGGVAKTSTRSTSCGAFPVTTSWTCWTGVGMSRSFC